MFITEVTRTTYNGADVTNSTINSYVETTMNSTVVLGSSSSSTITYNVWLYNNSDKDHVFIDVTKDEMAYKNTNITYSTDLVPYETVIGAGQNMDFNITFSYAGSDVSNNTLNSVLNFRFMEIPKLELSGAETITNIYPGASQEKTFTVTNFNSSGINGVPLDYTMVGEIYDESGNKITEPITATICNESGTAVTGAVSMTGDSATKTTHTYKLKLAWDASYNSVDYAGKTYSYKIKAVAVPNVTATESKYADYTLTKETTANITTAPLYFVTDPTSVETTTKEMSDGKVALNLTISNNDGKNYNVFETRYKIALDNTDFTLWIDGKEYANNVTELRTLGTREVINIIEAIELKPKTASKTLTTEEICNLTISVTSPYVRTEVIKIIATDKTAPTAPEISGGGEEWATSRTISVSKVATDVGMGVQNYEYLLNNTGQDVASATGNVGSTEAETSKTFTTEYNGYYIWFRAVDKVGNVGEWSNSQMLNIETTAPTITLGSNSNTNWSQTGSVTVKLQDTTSGLLSGASIKYGWSTSLDTEPSSYTPVTPTYTEGTTSEVTFTAEASGLTGKYYLWVVPTTLKDKAGNSNTTTVKSTGQFYFDNEKPNLSVANTVNGTAYSGEWTAGPITSVLTFSDDKSGIDADMLQYKTDSQDWIMLSNTSTTAYTDSWSQNRGETGYYRIYDNAGNYNDVSLPVYIDTNSPTVSVKSTASATIDEGTSTDLSTYFNIDKNGNAPITSIVYTDTSNNNTVITDTNQLAVGTHTIQATVEKETGATATAMLTIIVVALGFTLTFIANGSVFDTITGAKTVSFPEEDPTLEGTTFTGWYYDEATTQQANVGDSVTKDMNLYAKWKSAVLNPNNGETQVIVGYYGNAYPAQISDAVKYGAYTEEDFDTIYIYESSSEIEYLEIDPTTTTADFYRAWCDTPESAKSKYIDLDDAEMYQYLYSEGNVLKLDTANFVDLSAAVMGNAIKGLVGVKIHFKDGTIEEDVIDFLLYGSVACLVEGSQIKLADKTTKAIEDITYDDRLLVWDFDKGEFNSAKPLWIMKKHATLQYNLLKFSDGSELKTVDQHRIFNKEAGKFTYPMTDETPIGTTTFTDEGKEVKLIGKEVIREKVNYYNIITEYHMNLFANGILTSCRLSNLYNIENMKYIKDNRPLTPREAYPTVLDEYYYGLRLAEQPKEVNRDNDVKHSEDLEGYVQNLINKAKPKK